MLTLTTRQQTLVGLVLAGLIIATRGQHFATLTYFPGASWAVFFLTGVYLRSVWALPGLFVLTWLLDFAAFTWGNISGFCLTPAYVFLLPAYSALWLAGRWYAGKYRFEWQTLMPLLVAVLAGAVICKLFSSGGFYFFSGRFTNPTFSEFGTRLLRYFPGYLQSLTFYVGIAVMVHTILGLAKRAVDNRNVLAG